MTVIEYYSEAAIENIALSMTLKPERMVMIYHKAIPKWKIESECNKIREILCNHDCGLKELIMLAVDIENVKNAAEDIYRIAKKYSDCVFDVTGGDNLVMLAMGIAYERLCTGNVQIIRHDIEENTLTDYDGDGVVPEVHKGQYISAKENIELYGGKCYFSPVKYDDELEQDLKKLWNINRKSPSKWNVGVSLLEKLAAECGDRLKITERFSGDIRKFSREDRLFLQEFAGSLENAGVLIAKRKRNGAEELWYKNGRIKQWLGKAGNIFELFVYCAAEKTVKCRRDNMAMMSVNIHWDNRRNLYNEIDVVFMYGFIPVFISCKNGRVGDAELYKFKIVADKFGGPYGVKILMVSSPLENFVKDGMGIRYRAACFGIDIIDNVSQLESPGQLSDKIKKLIHDKIDNNIQGLR